MNYTLKYTNPKCQKQSRTLDLTASLAPRRLLMVNVTDGARENADYEIINDDLSIVTTTYQYGNAERNLIIKSGELVENLYNSFLE